MSFFRSTRSLLEPSLKRLLLPVLLSILAVAPEFAHMGVLRLVGRYGLIAYLPGFVVCRMLGRKFIGPIDLVLAPSFYSILPFAGIGIGFLSLGAKPQTAAWMAIAVFLAAGMIGSRRFFVERDRGQWIAVVVACLLCGILLLVPFAANGFRAANWDAPLHAAIATRVLEGEMPPSSPMVAGQPVNYYWLYHAYAALISAATGISLYQIFALLSAHGFVLLILAGYKLTRRLTTSEVARWSGVWLLVFGLNPLGWLFFCWNSARYPDPWFSLLVPLEMVRGFPAPLASLIHQFLDGQPFPLALPFAVAWIEQILRTLEGENDRQGFWNGVLALTGVLYLHFFTGVLLAGTTSGAVMAVRVLSGRQKQGLGRGCVLAFAMIGLSMIVAAPYAWQVLHGKAAMPLVFKWESGFFTRQVWALAASIGLLAILGVSGWREMQSGPSVARGFLGAYVLILVIAILCVQVVGDVQYKLIYLLLLVMAPLAGIAWVTWRRNLLSLITFISLLVICLPTNIMTSYAFLIRPVPNHLTPEKRQFYAWLNHETSPDSIFVEAPYWLRSDITQDSSLAEYLFKDRFWFDIAIYARRRLLVGYET